MSRLSLRTRVTVTFAAGALFVSASMAVLSYELTRQSLLTGRERAAARTATADAAVVRGGLTTADPDIVNVLRSLDTGGSRRALLFRNGQWYARSADAGYTAAVPARLQALVAAGHTGMQRVRTDAGPVLVIGIALDGTTQFYVVDSLRELDQTLQVLALILTLVAAGTTIFAAGLGFYTTRQALRPLTSVAAAARDIAGGDLTARLDPAAEPELAHLTTSFNEMVERLSERLRQNRRFAADVSHELRSPLQTLAAAASVLQRRRDQLDPRSAQAIDLISQEVDSFSELVRDLLELARGDLPADRAPVDVGRLARRVCEARAVTPDIVTDQAEPVWYVDQRRLEQILANLVDNAQRYGGGPIRITFGSRPSGGYVLEVDDEGPGVPAQDRRAIFDRFVRGHAAHARGTSEGAGLGLAIVTEHANAHGGRVTVTDRPGGGARFRVELAGTSA